MSAFHVGQRVRIVRGRRAGHLATIWQVSYNGRLTTGGVDVPRGVLLYRVDIDGIGRLGDRSLPIAYLASELEPIDDDKPEAGSWDEIQKLTRWNPSQVRA